MSVVKDIKATRNRFAIYIDRLSNLLKRYHVNGEDWYSNLKSANNNPEFVARRNEIWKDLLEQEGGKLAFGSVLAIIGTVLGGAGIVVGGGGYALPPLILLLTPVGLGIGNEMDETGLTKKFLQEVSSWFENP